MANLIISGSAVTLKSALKASTIKQLRNLKPEWLVVKDEKNNELYRVTYDEVLPGSISPKGVSFDKKDRAGYAMVTIMFRENLEAMTNDVLNELCAPFLLPLARLEKAIAVKMPALEEELNATASMITILASTPVAEAAPEPEARPETPNNYPAEGGVTE